MSMSSIGRMDSQMNQKGLSDTTSIDQKIKQLEEQLKRIKSDKKLSGEERDKKIENVQKQIEKLKQLKEQKTRASEGEPRQQSQRESVAPVDEGHLINTLA